MSNAGTPVLVGVAPPVSEILLLQKWPNFPFGLWTKSMVIKKFNLLASAQKIHASRRGCVMHALIFVGVASLVSEILLFSNFWPNFPFRPWTPWWAKIY